MPSEDQDEVWGASLSPLGLSFKPSASSPLQHRKARGLFYDPSRASRAAPLPGDPAVVLSSLPFATCLSPSLWGSHCNRCFRPGTLRCSGCKAFRYCSRACQRRDWEEAHRHGECKGLAAAVSKGRAEAGVLSDLVLLYRTFRRIRLELQGGKDKQQQAEGGEEEAAVLHPSARQVLDLDDASVSVEVDAMIEERARLLTPLLSALLLPAAGLGGGHGPSTGEVAAMLRRFQTNNFAIVDGLWRPLGSGVFPFGALLQHSCCRPTCLLSYRFDPASLSWRQDVRRLPDHHQQQPAPASSQEGEGAMMELTHSYVDAMTPAPERRQMLRLDYGFDCHCCCCCRGAASFPSSALQWYQRVQELLQLADEAGSNEEQEEELSLLLQALALVLQPRGPSTINKEEVEEEGGEGRLWVVQEYRVRGRLLGLAVEMGRPALALQQARAMLPLLRRAYRHCPCHPLMGLHLYTLADLEGQQQQQEGGQEEEGAAAARRRRSYYEEALRVLRATHGPGHELVHGLQELLLEEEEG